MILCSDAAMAALVSGASPADDAATGAAEHTYRRGGAGSSTIATRNRPRIHGPGAAQAVGASTANGE